MAGWGETEQDRRATTKKYPEYLQEVTVPIRNTAQCEQDYRRLSNKNKSGTFDLKFMS